MGVVSDIQKWGMGVGILAQDNGSMQYNRYEIARAVLK